MWVPVYDGLFLEFEFARVCTTAFYAHGAVVIAVDFTNYDVIYRSGDLAPLKCLPIFKLKSKNPHRIKLNGTTPELAFEIRISPKLPTSALTVAGNNHRMMTNLKRIERNYWPKLQIHELICLYRRNIENATWPSSGLVN